MRYNKKKRQQPRIVNLKEKKLTGIRMTMNLANNRTGELWKSFIQRRREITSNLTGDLISMQIYNSTYFTGFDPANEFEKWAATKVTDFDHVPGDMETFTLPGGLYAVFDYKGNGNDPAIFQFIFGTWLPGSDYLPDDRPHFEVLGKN
jgi:AraC family transcriptional regulator